MNNQRLREQLLAIVPDDPVWIEARAVLLDPESRISGDADGYVVRSDRTRLAAIGGEAREAVIRKAFSDIEDAGSDPTALWAVLIPGGFTKAARAALSGWTTDEAYIHREPDSGGIATRPVSADVRRVTSNDLPGLEGLADASLGAELCEAFERGEMVAAWVDGRPVSFCYVACETETLWDISINTVSEYRRRGLASESTAFLAAAMKARGKRAVWGAHSDNDASRRLAAKLGFEPWGRLCLFENWSEGPMTDSEP